MSANDNYSPSASRRPLHHEGKPRQREIRTISRSTVRTRQKRMAAEGRHQIALAFEDLDRAIHDLQQKGGDNHNMVNALRRLCSGEILAILLENS